MNCNHIVIDASIARSVGNPPRDNVAKDCRDFVKLLDCKDCRTGALMTPAIIREWKKHASPFMTRWLVSMEIRKRVRHEKDRPVRELRAAVSAVVDEGIRVALEKDLHLSEAAILYGVAVSSRDDKQRDYLARLAMEYPLASGIQWLNPARHRREDWMEWVRAGCVDRSVFLTTVGFCASTRGAAEQG